MNHEAHVIWLNQEFSDNSFNYWMGDSAGHYAGDTLVVETTNFHSQQNFRSSLEHQFYGSTEMKVSERFARVSDEVISYQFTVDDSENYDQPWNGKLPMNKSSEQICEYACHEGNYALLGVFAGARRAEVDGIGCVPTN